MRKAILIFRRSLKVNLKRYLLYSAGVALSVASVLLVGTLSNMAFSSIERELDRVVFNGVEIKMDTFSSANTAELISSVAKQSGSYAMPCSNITAMHDQTVCTVWGVDSRAQSLYSLNVVQGRFFTLRNVNRRERVCVIGKALANSLSSNGSCIGNMLHLNVSGISEPFRIVGIYSSGYIDKFTDVLGESVYIPHTVAEDLLGVNYSASYQVAHNDADNFLRVLNERVGELSYTAVDMTLQRQQLNGVFNTITNVLSLITGVSVVVAAFNMLVITWIHVKSSYKEIGLKKSLGASKYDILLEYIVESIGIAWIGVAIGVGINLLFCLVMNFAGNAVEFGVWRIVGVATAVTVLSALFGLVPSCIAARLQPIDTLRSS